ncbi:MAG: O-methyltransferase [Bacteroidetes bacterium]|nr:O-methyltransferase [Bacteroidota bacterium]
MDFLPDSIDEYARNFSSAEPELLKELNRETHLKVLSPRMLSGHLQGRFLSIISNMIRPDLVVEIGTYTGYSALCLAEGLSEKGRLITIDNNRELRPFAESYFARSPHGSKIQFLAGNAADLIPSLPDQIDLAFIDADKENYSRYFDLLIDKVRPGGFLLADNVLWSGKVVQPVKENDQSTKAICAFNEKVNRDHRVETMLLPLRDGIMIIRKK